MKTEIKEKKEKKKTRRIIAEALPWVEVTFRERVCLDRKSSRTVVDCHGSPESVPASKALNRR
jgi:hypothetical protein